MESVRNRCGAFLAKSGDREIDLLACQFFNFSRSKSGLDLAGRKAVYEQVGAKGEPTEYSNHDSEKYEDMVVQIKKKTPEEKLCAYCCDGVEAKEIFSGRSLIG